jgi:SAM-dependent methyltransferase
VSLSSFHFWPDPLAALRELHRVLRPHGRLVLTDWCDDFFSCRVCNLYLKWRDPAHRRIYGRNACEQMLNASGFQIHSVDRYKISWLWGLMTAIAEKVTPRRIE